MVAMGHGRSRYDTCPQIRHSHHQSLPSHRGTKGKTGSNCGGSEETTDVLLRCLEEQTPVLRSGLEQVPRHSAVPSRWTLARLRRVWMRSHNAPSDGRMGACPHTLKRGKDQIQTSHRRAERYLPSHLSSHLQELTEASEYRDPTACYRV